MDDCSIFATLGQVSSSDAGAVFRDFLRGSVRQMICEVMAAEVNELCGPKHHPSDSAHFRSGAQPGVVSRFFRKRPQDTAQPQTLRS